MKHRKSGIKLNRTASHRDAMFRNMVTSLFKHDRIRTTDAKAKELRRWADKMITLAKRGDLHARRQVLAIIREKAVVHKLFEEAADRFGSVDGGYTRIVKIGRRPGDAAPISLIELIEPKPKKKADKKTKKKTTKPAKPAEKRAASAPVKASEAVEEATAETAAETSAEEPVEEKAAAPAADRATDDAAPEPETDAPDEAKKTDGE